MSRRAFRHELAATLVFLAWSGATAAGDESKPIDACALLNESDIEQALRLDVEAPERSDAGYTADEAYSSTCVWKVATAESASKELDEFEPDDEAPLGGRHFVILNAMLWPRGKGMAGKFLEAFYLAAERGDIPHTSVKRALGDDALSWGDGLAVRKGDVSFGVSVFVPGMSKERAGAIEEVLARRILPRLGAGAR